MLNLEELEQLVAFADYGTLSKAAEALHISQPTITRTMQTLEEVFGVSLFTRSKNRIELNETGKRAVEQSRALLMSADQVLRAVRAYDKSLNTILVESCAPAPLWIYMPGLSQKYPSKTISTKLADSDQILQDVLNGESDLGIVLNPVNEKDILCKELISEHLSVCLPSDHAALDGGRLSLTLSSLNGYNCLLRSDLGFWDKLVREHMPSSKFLVQEDEFTFRELTKNSTLPFFVTDIGGSDLVDREVRTVVPITDKEANVTYYLIRRKE